VDDAIDVGEKIAYRSEYGFQGTRYLPTTIAQISGGKLLGNVFSKGSILTAVGASLAANAIDYGFGEDRDKGVASQEFVVSTAVDTALAVGTGLAAAATVAAVGMGLTAAGLTVPFWGAGLAVLGVGVGIGLLLDSSGVSKEIKEGVNTRIDLTQENARQFGTRFSDGLDAWDGVINNAQVVGSELGARLAASSSDFVPRTGGVKGSDY
jgi:hypothetical protein